MIWRDRSGNSVEATYRQPLPGETKKRPGDLVLQGDGKFVRVEKAA